MIMQAKSAPVMAMSPAKVLFWVIDVESEWITVIHYKEEWEWLVHRNEFKRWKMFQCRKEI